MVMKEDQTRIKALLSETIRLLCKNGLHFSTELSIEALIGVTLDQNDVFLINIKETISSDSTYCVNTCDVAVKRRLGSMSECLESMDRCDVTNADYDSQCHTDDSVDVKHSFELEKKRRVAGNVRKRKRTFQNNKLRMNGDCFAVRLANVKNEFVAPTEAAVTSDVSNVDSERLGSDAHLFSVEEHRRTGVALDASTSSASLQCIENIVKNELKLERVKRLSAVTDNVDMNYDSSYSNSFVQHESDDMMHSSDRMESEWSDEALGVTQLQLTSNITSHQGSAIVELLPGSNVYLRADIFELAESETKGSRLVRLVARGLFTDSQLAASSCLGQSKTTSHGCLQQDKIDTLLLYVQSRVPEMSESQAIRIVNNVCCEARRKDNRQQFNNNYNNAVAATTGASFAYKSLLHDADIDTITLS